tara:strand:- start:8690 stop:8992 length:303 start_codon:yes stop_codon:yes gene_type:complete
MKIITFLFAIIIVFSLNLQEDFKSEAKNNICEKLSIPDLTFKDTLDMDGYFETFESSILSHPQRDSIFLTYTDSIVFYDPKNYTEYIMLIKRKVPLQYLN